MKVLTTLLIFTCVFLQCTSVFTQDEKNGQKWYCYEETVLPELHNDYVAMAMELVKLCKENDFPYTFHTWTTGDFKYQLWTPINSLNDIDKINEAWKELLDKWSKENIEKFTNTKISNYSSTIVMRPDLTYEPQKGRLGNNEIKFFEWKEYYLQTGKLNEAIEIQKKVREKLVTMNYEDSWFWASGGLGYDDPCLITWTAAKDFADSRAQQDNFHEIASDDLIKTITDFNPCIRTMKTKYMMYMDKLSYVKE